MLGRLFLPVPGPLGILEACDLTSSTAQVEHPPPSRSERPPPSLRASPARGEGAPQHLYSLQAPPHTLLTSWRAAASPLPGGPVPGLQRPGGWAWGPGPGPGRAGGGSAEEHSGPCRFCLGTQSDPTILCSQTASAMYLGSNKPDERGHGPPAWTPSAWGAQSPRRGPAESWDHLIQATVSLYPTTWGRNPQGQGSGGPRGSHIALQKTLKEEGRIRARGDAPASSRPPAPGATPRASGQPTHLGPSGAQIVKYQLLAQPRSKGLYPCRYWP